MKHWGKAVFGTAVTVFLLWFVLRDENPREILAAVRDADLRLLFASIFVATFGFFIRALRWNVLLAPVKSDTALRSRFAGVSIGFMANNLLPARIGEFARAFAFSRMEPVSASAAFGTLVVERFMDGVVLLLFLVLPVFTAGFPASDALLDGRGGLILRGGVLAVVAVMLMLVFMVAFPRQFSRLARRVAAALPTTMRSKVLDGLDSFLDSLAIMRDPKLLVLGFTWTLGFWLWHSASFWLGMKAFGIETGFVSAIFTTAVVGFAVAIPAAPGFFGTFHGGADFALSSIYGVSGNQSLAFAFGYHLGGFIPITLIGLWYAWSLGMSLGDVGSADEVIEEQLHPDPGVHGQGVDRGSAGA